MIAAFHTLGCKTNAYETQAVLEQFRAAGFEIGEFSGVCDVYVINTCAVTQEAARKSRQMIGRCRKKNPHAVVVVTGCYAQDAGDKILADSMADIVVGNSMKSEILPRVTDKLRTSLEGSMAVKDLTHCTEYEDQIITGQGDHVRAYVKIQDGCDRFCSYCLIPFMRGRSRSRGVEEILSEAQTLAAGGYHELVLTGIDISSFTSGHDPAADVAELIEKLSAVEGIDRIRLGSLEVSLVTEPFVSAVRNVREFCPQFHLSLQSGCDAVLKRMNRHYTTEEYMMAVQLIRKYFPDAAVTTDIIAGFPGETAEEFETTLEFMEKVRFSRVHAFPYSR
ncbi:MAG: tRNA (N(6)-L-threonylcarbamoyladenosine(37)-C(2))-methylthiotransferase MtaB, partial [Parasporobacterium sp.]|nr:tRNA (N(6)-L-threonylcarbamoyladenosine(37)-C(2))-methylthiotransferase MtaB [Parasporobacterium sp.]